MSNLTDALIAAKLMGGSGGSGGGSGLPPIESSVSYLIPEAGYGFTQLSAMIYGHVFNEALSVTADAYTVIWDGTSYECPVLYQNGLYAFGNLSILGVGDDTGEPFCITNSEGVDVIGTTSTEASHTVEVFSSSQTPPDGYVLGVDGGEWKAMPNEGGALICHVNNDTGEFDVTWQQIFDALSQGKRVMSVDTNNNSAMQIVLYIAKKNSNSYDIYDTTRTSGSTPIASCTSANAHPVYK